MKTLILVATCCFITSFAFAQRGTLAGHITTGSPYYPLQGVEVFLYGADSSIAGSGVTDTTGFYETNQVDAGAYNIKIVYPSTKAMMHVTGTQIRAGRNTRNIHQAAPATDITLADTDLAAMSGASRRKRNAKMQAH